MAVDSGIPMSVLLEEPDDFIGAMFAVLERRAEQVQFGPDSIPWDE